LFLLSFALIVEIILSHRFKKVKKKLPNRTAGKLLYLALYLKTVLAARADNEVLSLGSGKS
jgi:hypothetical protein